MTDKVDGLVERLNRQQFRTPMPDIDRLCNEAATALTQLQAETVRLTECLKAANSQTEEFERKWYLRGDEIEQLQAELSGKERECQRLRELFLADAGNDVQWEAYHWLQANSTVQLGLSTIGGLYKFMRDKALSQGGEGGAG